MKRENINFILKTVVLASSITTFSTPSWAQFRQSHRDCLNLGDELPIPGEALNDTASYMLPGHWERQWYQHDGAAARFSAGSINTRDFLYSEDLKFSSAPANSSLWIFFERRRMHNKWNSGDTNELALTLPAPATLSLLTDSDAVKKNSDLGIAVGMRRSSIDYAELFLWSIDHFYNAKETSSARWSKKPVAFGARLSAPEGHGPFGNLLQRAHAQIQVRGVHEQKTESRQEEITCAISGKSLQADGTLSDQLQWHAEWIAREITLEATNASRNSERMTGMVGVSWSNTKMLHSSRSSLTDSIGFQMAFDDLKREKGAFSARRREIIATFNRSWNNDHVWSWFTGIVGSRGEQKIDDGTNRETAPIEQAKLQTGFEYRNREQNAANTPNGVFRALANWDLDHLSRDFPYQKRAFRPWDGGLLQFSFYQ
jgi:hypothetical protein